MDLPTVIIFGNSHHNTLGLLRSLGEKGIKPILLLEPCDLKFCCVRFSKYITKIHYLTSVEDGLRVLREEYWNEAEKPIILNAGDPSICLLDAHYDELKDHFHIFNAKGEQGRISYFMDKASQFPVAERYGLDLIKTWRIDAKDALPNDIVYPCLIKGNNSTTSSKEDMVICHSADDLREKLHNNEQYIVQEYIEKDCELDITGFSWNHGENVYIPAAVNKVRETLTRQSDYIRLDDIGEYKTLKVDAIKKFVHEIGYEGIFSIEVLRKGDTYYFLEMNLRNDGVGWLYTVAGANYPYLWCMYKTDGNIDEAIADLKCETPLTLMQLWDVQNVIRKRVSIGKWICQAFSTNAHFVMNWYDMRPYLYCVWILLRQAGKKILRNLCI